MNGPIRKHWLVHPHDAARSQSLERSLGISPLLAQLLIRRNLHDPETAARFLDSRLSNLHPPAALPGVPQAVEIIANAIDERKQIVVYGDYDADGMTATAILVRCFQLLGGNVSYYVPNRLDDGYGLNIQAITTLAERGAQLVVTVDCGIASLDSVHAARQLGLQIVVTDHHQFGDELPDADAVIHPAHPHGDYPFADLCGAGVALKIAWALCQRASHSDRVAPAQRDFLMMAVGMAAIGTVCDVVPLVDENRIIVRHGLAALKTHPCLGIQSLISVCKLQQNSRLNSEDLAFTLGPRLNAAGRLGQAQLGVELLTTQSPPRAQALAEYLHQLNSSRESLDRSVYLAANKQIKDNFDVDNDCAFVLAGRNWHAGVIGLVAGRLVEKYHRPTVLISLDPVSARPGIASGRSIESVHLYQALESCREHLLSFGGHAAAAGFKIAEDQVDSFRTSFCEYVSQRAQPADFTASVHVDVEAIFAQLNLETLHDIERLAPFGQANPRPVLCASSVKLAEAPKCIGKEQRHLSLRMIQHRKCLKAIAFGRADWAEHLQDLGQPLDIVFRPYLNEYRGFRRVELQLLDWRPAQVPASAASSP